MEYRLTSNVVYACQYHVVFCPKYRRKVLVGKVESRLKQILEDAAGGMQGVEILEMEVMPDHVHLLLEVAPQLAVRQVVRRLKDSSSRILRDEFPSLKSKMPSFWTNSYFCSTVGGAPLGVVQDYISNQKRSQRDKEKMG